MKDVDDRVATAERAVLSSLEREETLGLALAEGRADTGDLLDSLERACAQSGVNRIDCVARVREEARRRGLEELSEGGIRSRKSMARFRLQRPPAIAKGFLALSPARQKAVATLPVDRLDEFLHRGVPGSDRRLKHTKCWQVTRAVKACKRTPPGEPIVVEQDWRSEAERKALQQLARVMAMLRGLGSVTLAQAEQLLVILVSLFATATREESRTTRRSVAVEPPPECQGTVAIETVLEALDELSEQCRRVEFDRGVDRNRVAGLVCGTLSRVLRIISQWTSRTERETG